MFETWLSLVKFVSIEFFQLETGFGKHGSIHTGVIEPDISTGVGRTQRWPSPTSFHDVAKSFTLCGVPDPQGLDD